MLGFVEGTVQNPTKKIDDVLDITKQYNNLLQRNENDETSTFTWDFNVISANKHNQQLGYLQDDLGSPIRLLGDQGSQQDVLGYDEFGNDLAIDSIPNNSNNISNILQPFGFTGYQTDTAANSYFAQARQYNPKVGRFAGEDKHWNVGNMIQGDFGTRGIPDRMAIMQSNNLYNYTINNPVNFTDPLGLCVEEIDLDVSGNHLNNPGFIMGMSQDGPQLLSMTLDL